MKIKETCKCGATFEVDGDKYYCSYQYEKFLDAHEVCRNLNAGQNIFGFDIFRKKERDENI